jgi:NhaP-type Na+/H+ and K+/H+ antiporter
MQSYTDQHLVKTLEGSLAELTKAMPAEATHHVIGKVPQFGDDVVINGLTWVVMRVNDQIGTLRLRLKKPQL